MRISDVGCIYLSTQCSEMYHKCFICAAVPPCNGYPRGSWCVKSAGFLWFHFGDKCNVSTDKTKKTKKINRHAFVLCWCVSGCKRVCVCVYVWAQPGWYCSGVLNTCNPPKALNTVTVYSNGSLVIDSCTEVLNS